jgi:hypothetical protein
MSVPGSEVPPQVCGGHGPAVVPFEELSVLSSYGDRAKFEAAHSPDHP